MICLSLLFLCFPLRIIKSQTYNSFLQQTGYCKLQHFETLSRTSSGGIPAYQRGDILFYIGLTHFYFNHSQSTCGICLNVTHYHQLYDFNFEINERLQLRPPNESFIVMVADECTDPICQPGFIDIDIYTEKQAPFYDSLQWHEIQCPLLPTDVIEYFICFSQTCQRQSIIHSDSTVKDVYDPYYQSITIRNHPFGIISVHLQFSSQTILFQDGQGAGWVNSQYLDLHQWMENPLILLVDKYNHTFEDTLIFDPEASLNKLYHGAYVIYSHKSWIIK